MFSPVIPQRSHEYTLLNGDAYNDTDVPEVVHHVDSENPNVRDDEDEVEKVKVLGTASQQMAYI